MGYVEDSLNVGENVIYRGNVSLWGVCTLPAIIALIFYALGMMMGSTYPDSGLMTSIGYGLGMILVGGIIWGPVLLIGMIRRKTTEIALTNQRVILKTGIIRRNTFEINLGKVEGINIDQGIIGRILDYGTISVRGTGGGSDKFKSIANPLGLRKAINTQLAGN